MEGGQSGQQRRYTKRLIGAGIIVIVIVISVIAVRARQSHQVVTAGVTTNVPQVHVAPVNTLTASSTFQTIGTVSAVSEAHVQSQASGQVTSVPVKLGQTVTAGTVIATLDNASQNAALLQAKGAYDAAVAATKVGDISSGDASVGVASAVTAASTNYQNAYTTVSSVVYNTLDQFYGNPNGMLPGVLLATNQATYLNNERVALQTILPNWQQAVAAGVTEHNADTELTNAITITERIAKLTDTLINITQAARSTAMLNGKTVNSYTPTLLAARATLNGTIASLKGSQTALATAQSALQKAQLSGSAPNASLANAQLLQAEGALRAAQANYDKTIIRTPINGTINALYVRTGDNANMNTPIALIANNQGLEVDTNVTEADSMHIAVGDTVTINTNATGTITAIAGALDPTTGKIAVKISVANPKQVLNGSTALVTFAQHTPIHAGAPTFMIPLTAVKMNVDTANVFTISTSSASSTATLVAHTITLGQVVGDAVIVTAGITPSLKIVTDARGLAPGQHVTVSQ